MQFIDLYQLLGVSRHASEEDLKKAFRALARDLHPDTSPLPRAKEKFQVLNQAYQILSDPFRRKVYNLQYDRHYALLLSHQEKKAEEGLFDAPPAGFYSRQERHPVPPQPRTRTTTRQPGEPFVSMRDIRQKQFIRFIPTVRMIAVFIWVMLAFQIVDRLNVKVGEVEEIYSTELKNGRMSGLVMQVVTEKSEFREDSYGYLGLEAPDLVQFERTWLFGRNTVLLVVHSPFPTKDKVVGEEYPNRVFYPWYFLTAFLLFCSFAAYFLSDQQAELRFKFGLACIFFFLLYLGIQFIF